MNANRMFYVCSTMTCVNSLVSAGFSLAMLINQPLLGPATMYGIARSVPLAIAALVVAARRSYGGLMVLAPLLGTIQACDAIVGWLSHDLGKTIGPVILAILTFASMVAFTNQVRRDRAVFW